MSYHYLFKEENLTEDQKQRLYDLSMELGPRNHVCYREHIADIKAEAICEFAKYINDTGELNFGDSNFVMQEAHGYAEQLRQGGE